MSTNWLDLAGSRFSQAVKAIMGECSTSLDGNALGDEDTQCQHLFTSIFFSLKAHEQTLTGYLVEDSTVPNLLVEFKYYRSKRRRNRTDDQIQFVERETGADFALSLMVHLPGIAFTQRHVLAQAKLIQSSTIRLDHEQLALLDESAGGELGLYCIWGEGFSPSVLTIANLKAVINASGRRSVRLSALRRFTRPLEDYVVDDFLGLWHGADFHQEDYDETPPKESPPVLYHLLHAGEPPPNTAHFGFRQATSDDIRPGFHVQGLNLPDETAIESR